MCYIFLILVAQKNNCSTKNGATKANCATIQNQRIPSSIVLK